MGRPYDNEIRSLPDTYRWAVAQTSEPLRALCADEKGKTLVAVGSGGSFSTASTAVALHTHYNRSPGYAITPLELEASSILDCGCSIWLFSGSGRNVDIRRAAKAVAPMEGNQATVVCGKHGSPLERDAKKAGISRVFSFETGFGKDGYLATNSLFASVALLASAYTTLPDTIEELIAQTSGTNDIEATLQSAISKACVDRDNAIILHGPSGRAGALDLESKLSEGAISACSVADFRNFAHGRHNWLNRFGDTSWIVAFVGPGEESLAEKTLGLIPDQYPRVVVPLGSEFAAAQVASIYFAIRMTGWLGKVHDLDPGRPKIPTFGRSLYHLKTRLGGASKVRTAKRVVIERKIAAVGTSSDSEQSLTQWTKHYDAFRQKINAQTIRAIVFDYDGTIVDTTSRFDPPTGLIVDHLLRLLKSDIVIGMASGRGDSLREALTPIIPNDLHDLVLLGYCNASTIGRLSEDCDVDGPINDSALIEFESAFSDTAMSRHALRVRTYPRQISIKPREPLNIANLAAEIRALVDDSIDGQLKVQMSSHSVDVIPKSTSKLALVDEIAEQFGVDRDAILRVGDNGRPPGNDCELLRSPLGLSVGSVSADPDTCWNILPPRCKGADGTHHYLEKIVASDGEARIRL